MEFTVLSRSEPVPAQGASRAYLIVDRWDDWAKFRTQFYLYVRDGQGTLHELGDVKIGRRGLLPASEVKPGQRAPELERSFETLPAGYFSLGQNENYYETLGDLPEADRIAVLKGLRDLAADPGLFDSVQDEPVVYDSLLRSVSAAVVKTRFHRLVQGDAELTSYRFRYRFPPSGNELVDEPEADFEVLPNSMPPTNVHVVIGRNGVGKTTLMQRLGFSMMGLEEDDDGPVGTLTFDSQNDEDSDEDETEDAGFSGLVSVSFSAFDDHRFPEPVNRMSVTEVGLRYTGTKSGKRRSYSPDGLARNFCQSFAVCRRGLRRARWEAAIGQLCNDPVFADVRPLRLLELEFEADDWAAKVKHFYKRLSSGHKIVLLSITKLVELVDERTLVLLDEPEAHLHPPLLSAYIRSISELLIRRNGVAIVATHSPVVLQEVPKSCVWVLSRIRRASWLSRPQNETFGENVGRLTREAFGLEVTHSGFHQLLRDAVAQADSHAELLRRFDRQLGAEALAISRSMMLRKRREAGAAE